MTLTTMIVRFSMIAITTGTLTVGSVFAVDPSKVPPTQPKQPVDKTFLPIPFPTIPQPFPFPKPPKPPVTLPVPMPVPTPAPMPIPTPAPMAPKLGIVGSAKPTGGFWVIEVSPNSPAFDMGLEAGDSILTINGTLINSNEKIVAALVNAQALNKGHVTLVVQSARGTGLVQIDADIGQSGPIATFAPGQASGKMTVKNVQRKMIRQ